MRSSTSSRPRNASERNESSLTSRRRSLGAAKLHTSPLKLSCTTTKPPFISGFGHLSVHSSSTPPSDSHQLPTTSSLDHHLSNFLTRHHHSSPTIQPSPSQRVTFTMSDVQMRDAPATGSTSKKGDKPRFEVKKVRYNISVAGESSTRHC